LSLPLQGWHLVLLAYSLSLYWVFSNFKQVSGDLLLTLSLNLGRWAGALALLSLLFTPYHLFVSSYDLLAFSAVLGIFLVALSVCVMTVGGFAGPPLPRGAASVVAALGAVAASLLALLLTPDLKPVVRKGGAGQLLYDPAPLFLFTLLASIALILLYPLARRKMERRLEERAPGPRAPAEPVRAPSTVARKRIVSSSFLKAGLGGAAFSLVFLLFVPAPVDSFSYMLVAFSWYILSLYIAWKLYQVPEAYLVTGASDQLSFFCPRCKQKIAPFEQSGDLVEKYAYGEIRLGRAWEGVVVSHYRHAHTDYDKERRLLRRLAMPPDYKQQKLRELRARYAEEARQLAAEDGLLKLER